MSDLDIIPLPGSGKKKGGRPAGALGYFGRSTRLILEQAFEQMGGMDAFVAWGKDNKTEFYKLWSKLLPQVIPVPTSLDAARLLLAQLEADLNQAPMEMNIEPMEAEIINDGPDSTDRPDSPAGDSTGNQSAS